MWTKAEKESFRRRLSAWKDRLAVDLSQLHEEALRAVGAEPSGGLSNVPVHPADLAADASEEDVTLGLLGNEEGILAEVDAALARLDAGTFGRCENCRRPIPKERLRAAPYARYCLDCEKQQECGESDRQSAPRA